MQVLPRQGVVQGIERTPAILCLARRLVVIAFRPSGNADAAIMTAGEFQNPPSGVHEGAVLRGELLRHQSHRYGLPDFTDAPSRMPPAIVIHAIEELRGASLRSLGIDRILPIGCQPACGSHRKGQVAGFAIVVAEAGLRGVVAVWHAASTGKAVEVAQGTLEGGTVDVNAAGFCEQQEREGGHARRIQVSAGVIREGAAAARPAAGIDGVSQLVRRLLHERQHHGIPGPQIVFSDANPLIADRPGVVGETSTILHPAAHHGEVVCISGGEKEQDGSPFILALCGEPVGEIAHDQVRLRAIERPGRTVGAHHGDVHHLRPEVLDLEGDDAVTCFRIRDDFTEHHARVHAG